ncbi:hypothetical protein PLESTB_001693900 [Pleodorina starrii]|uniref:Pherophorin domain-containing protein n=1 Tax=Pleodorina starrii TaxID=330485 RepID=A0A9W6F9P3_9CHLO|nr:hypothetical protein PLESTB_001693900 [Pleodorina starrii]
MFPFPDNCILGRNITHSPIRMSPSAGPFNLTATTATYCFRITANATVGWESECAHMDNVRKIDIVISADCAVASRKLVKAATINGVAVQTSISTVDWDGTPYGLLTVKKITNSFPTVPTNGGMYLCLALDQQASADATCTSPRALCRYGPSCVAQAISDDFSCCPIGEVGY